MVNYRRVVCEVAVLAATAALVCAAPVPCKDDRVFDQRQNGSENYRLNIDGVVIAVAPAESLLSAVSDLDFSDLIDFDALSEQGSKPKPPPSISDFLTGEDPPAPKPDEKPSLSKPEDKPSDSKPDGAKPEKPEAPVKISEISNEKSQKKSAHLRKQENAQRLKQRLANIFLPFLRKRRHQ